MTDKVQLIKEKIERLYTEVSQKPYNGEIEGEMCAYDKLISFIDSLPEEPASEDLEEELSNWRHNHFHGRRDKDACGEYLERKSQLDLARHFAEWQKQKDFKELLKSDMTQFKKCYEKGKADAMKEMKETLQTEYEKGRFDMREEMMKDAVDAFVNTYENTDDSNYVEFVTEQSPYKFKETEKCKLIIIKED